MRTKGISRLLLVPYTRTNQKYTSRVFYYSTGILDRTRVRFVLHKRRDEKKRRKEEGLQKFQYTSYLQGTCLTCNPSFVQLHFYGFAMPANNCDIDSTAFVSVDSFPEFSPSAKQLEYKMSVIRRSVTSSLESNV